MAEIAVYALVVIFLTSLISGMIVYQRFINRSMRAKFIYPLDERRTQWRFVFTIGLCGLSGGLAGSIMATESPGNSINIIELFCMTGLATIGFSLFAWIGFWMIEATLRARIKIETQKEAKKKMTPENSKVM